MAGWRKAWLAVLERGGSSGSLHFHLHGLHSPSSSSSSLNYKRSGGGKNAYGSHVKGNAVLVAVSVALVLAFFYVSVASGPTDDASFPSPTAAASSSSALFSWLSSSSASPPTFPRKSLPPHPPIPRAVSTAVQSNGGNNGTMRKQEVLIGAEDSVPVESTGQPEAIPEQTKEPSSPLNAGNTTMDLNRELVNNGTRAQEQQEEATLPMHSWQSTGEGANSSDSAVIGAPGEFMDNDGPGKLTDISISSLNQVGSNKNATGEGANSSHSAVIGALGELMDDGGASNSTDKHIVSNQEESSKNATVDAPREKVTPSSMEQKEHKHINKRIIRYKHPRRQKQIFHSMQERATEQNNGTTVDKNIGVAAGTGDDGNPGSLMKCDVFSGIWVRDKSYPFYPPGSCPHIDDDFNCHKNGRPDSDFLKWRWQPHGCDIPRLNAADFLERLRGQRIIFVGDSLNRNMWESLVCILRHGVRNKTSVYEASGRNQFKTRGYYSFKFKGYNCSVDFVRSIFLVKELIRENKGHVVDAKLKLDELDGTTRAYQTANIVVFNTGHWWTHSKTSRGQNYYQEGNHVYPNLDVMDAFKKALTTWARWVDKNIDTRRTQVVFRGYSLTHFRGGQWNSGGKCHRETEPIFNQTYLSEYPEKMRILEHILRQMKTPVIYLNISRLTDYRKDAHPSVYRMRHDTEEERIAAVTRQDCSHWCLPGVPDTWNELLYASLLQASKGSWRL